jgi:hypothetical protein
MKNVSFLIFAAFFLFPTQNSFAAKHRGGESCRKILKSSTASENSKCTCRCAYEAGSKYSECVRGCDNKEKIESQDSETKAESANEQESEASEH